MTIHQLSRGPLLSAAIALLLAGIFLACGPADESVQREIGNLPETGIVPQEADPTTEPTTEPTPEPDTECKRTEGSYPALDETLQDLVHQYETCALTEVEAAALAPEHAGPRVLVRIYAPDERLNELGTWLDAKNVNPNYVGVEDSVAYAYPKVSVLGTLSQQAGVTEVQALRMKGPPAVQVYPKPPLPVARDSDGTALPELPGWLKSYPHPRTYHQYDGGTLSILMRLYDNGDITDEDLDMNQPLVGCGVVERKVGVVLQVKNNPEDLRITRDWLLAQGVKELDGGRAWEPSTYSMPVNLNLQQIKEVVAIVDSARAYFTPCSLRPFGHTWSEELQIRPYQQEQDGDTVTEEDDNQPRSTPESTLRNETITASEGRRYG